MSKPVIMWAAIVSVGSDELIDTKSFQCTEDTCRFAYVAHIPLSRQASAIEGVRFARVEVKEIT